MENDHLSRQINELKAQLYMSSAMALEETQRPIKSASQGSTARRLAENQENQEIQKEFLESFFLIHIMYFYILYLIYVYSYWIVYVYS